MKYERQLQTALDRVDQSLANLRQLILRGQNKEAIQFMESGPLKERFEELQNMITISGTGSIGASGVQSIGSL